MAQFNSQKFKNGNIKRVQSAPQIGPHHSIGQEINMIHNGGKGIETVECLYCHSTYHTVFHCDDLAILSIPDRYTYIGNINDCMHCLNKGHPSDQCNASTADRRFKQRLIAKCSGGDIQIKGWNYTCFESDRGITQPCR